MMGGTITEGAIVQHLSKLRLRLMNQGIRVPPPLKRGGGGLPTNVSKAGVNARSKAKAKQSKEDTEEEDDDDENVEDYEYSEDEALVKPKGKAKGGKKASVPEAKAKTNVVKQELDDENALKTVSKSKRRHVPSDDDSESAPKPRRRRKVAKNNNQDKVEQKSKPAGTKTVPSKTVARNANFLEQVSGDENDSSEQSVPRRIVRLPIGNEERTKAFLERLGYDVGRSGETAQDAGSFSSSSSSDASYESSPTVSHGYEQVSQASHTQSGYQNAYGETYGTGQPWYGLATGEGAHLSPVSFLNASNDYTGVSLAQHQLQYMGYGQNIGGHMADPFGAVASPYGGNTLPTTSTGMQMSYRTPSANTDGRFSGLSSMTPIEEQYRGYGLGPQSSFGGVLGNAAHTDRSNDTLQLGGLPNYHDVNFPESFERGARTYDQVQRYVSAAHTPGTQHGSPSGNTTAARTTPQHPLLDNDFGGYSRGEEVYDAGIFSGAAGAGDTYGQLDTSNEMTVDQSVADNEHWAGFVFDSDNAASDLEDV